MRGSSILSLLLVLGACASGSERTAVDTRTTVEVRLDQPVPQPGESVPLVSVVRNAAGSVLGGAAVSWSSDAAQIATVSTAGVLTARDTGTVRITARTLDSEGTLAIRIAPSPLTVRGIGNVTDRFTAEVWVRGDWGYTTTWGRRGASGVGNQLYVWDLSGNDPRLVRTITIDEATTLGDVQSSDDGRWLVVATRQLGSLVIFDLADPSNPVRVARHISAAMGNEVHTAEVARVNGRLYVFASVISPLSRLVIVDITDPVAPREVFSAGMGSPILHDVFVRDGVLFTAIWDGGVGIWDLGGLGRGGTPSLPVPVSTVPIVGGHAHNIWWFHDPKSGSKRWLLVGEEGPQTIGNTSTGDIHVVDFADVTNPREVAAYTVPGAGAHNFSVDESSGVLYAAFYNGGVRALDIRGDLGSCSASQQRADGRCDLRLMGRRLGTALNATLPVYVWGVHWQDGTLYAADMLNGLWALDARALQRP